MCVQDAGICIQECTGWKDGQVVIKYTLYRVLGWGCTVRRGVNRLLQCTWCWDVQRCTG
jgi:hypothetical protein